jgi:hypothetical protein
MHTKLEVDVYGHWSDNPPDYRIYVNDEMMIERTFGWPSYQNYITEHMYCNLDTGVHTLRLENLDANSRFDLASFTVDKNPVNKNLLKTNGVQIEWRFVVDNLLNNQESKTSAVIDEPEKAIRPVSPAAPIERPRKVVQVKKYETYAPLVQRMRELNAKK